MKYKACDEPKPEQLEGCEDLGEEYNIVIRLYMPLRLNSATVIAVATAAFSDSDVCAPSG